MERTYSKRGKGYQFFLIIALFLSSSFTLAFIAINIYRFIRIDGVRSVLEVLQSEPIPDIYSIEATQKTLDGLISDVPWFLIRSFLSIGVLVFFIVLQIHYVKIGREPFKQELSASERIDQAHKKNREMNSIETSSSSKSQL